jgi:hypothetical protein
MTHFGRDAYSLPRTSDTHLQLVHAAFCLAGAASYLEFALTCEGLESFAPLFNEADAEFLKGWQHFHFESPSPQ